MRSFPEVHLSSTDENLACHFIRFIFNVKPEERPNAVSTRHHLLMKTVSNPFTKYSLEGMTEQNFMVGKGQGELSSSKLEAVNFSSTSSHNKGIHQQFPSRVKVWLLGVRYLPSELLKSSLD